MPLPLSVRSCVCGRRLDLFGHHWAACSRAGVLSRRGFAVESAVEQICREAGARVSTNVMIRDLDIAGSNTDARRLGDTQSLYVVCELLARGTVPNSIRDIVRIGRLTALQKPSGGVRGIAWTIAQQLSEAVESNGPVPIRAHNKSWM